MRNGEKKRASRFASVTSRQGSSGHLFSARRRTFSPSLPVSIQGRFSSDSDSEPLWLKPLLDASPRTLVTKADSWKWELERCREILTDGFGVLTLEALEIEKEPGCVRTCGALFDYLRETQKDFMPEVEFPKILRHGRLHENRRVDREEP